MKKYVFEKENAVAEAVLYAYPNYEKRTVICCSTQSGCPIGCRFCGAGDSFVRSLLTAETGGDVVDVLVEAMGQLGVEIEDVHDDTRADIEAALDKLGVGSLWPSL